MSVHVNAELAPIVQPNGRLQSRDQIGFRNYPGFPKAGKF
jgi:hypothetical protein